MDQPETGRGDAYCATRVQCRRVGKAVEKAEAQTTSVEGSSRYRKTSGETRTLKLEYPPPPTGEHKTAKTCRTERGRAPKETASRTELQRAWTCLPPRCKSHRG